MYQLMKIIGGDNLKLHGGFWLEVWRVIGLVYGPWNKVQ